MSADDKSDQDVYESAAQAYKVAWKQMLDSGLQAIKSSATLSKTKQEDVQIATTPCDVVFQLDKVTLSKYRPLTKKKANVPPVIICYGLFGRQTMIDLQEDRSLVRNLLSEGVDVYVVDWGNPTRADQFITVSDYIDIYLRGCVEYLVSENNNKPITLFGICEGGTFSTILAAHKPKLIAGLVLAITPIDFDGDQENFWEGEGFLNIWTQNLEEEDIDSIIETYGMLPGAMTGAVFSSLTPMNSMTKYNLGLSRLNGDEDAILNFLRMEKWIADRPDHPGAAGQDWLNKFYRKNQLVKGKYKIDGKKINLKNIKCPVLNIYALRDHIVPVSCTKALGNFVKPSLYSEIGFPGGHVGVFVSRKAQGVVAGGVTKWLFETQKSPKKKSEKKQNKTKSEIKPEKKSKHKSATRRKKKQK